MSCWRNCRSEESRVKKELRNVFNDWGLVWKIEWRYEKRVCFGRLGGCECCGGSCVYCEGFGSLFVVIMIVRGRDDSAACFASWSALLLPCVIGDESAWWDLQWTIPILVGSREAWRRHVMKVALVIDVPFVVSSPLSFQIAEWESKMWLRCSGLGTL